MVSNHYGSASVVPGFSGAPLRQSLDSPTYFGDRTIGDRRVIPLRILYNLTPSCTPTLAFALARRNSTSISQPIYRPIRQVLSHLINQLINPSVNQSISQSMNESVSQSINRPISHSVNSRSVAVDFNSILQICIRIGAGRRCAARGGAPPHWRRFYKNRNRVFGAKT